MLGGAGTSEELVAKDKEFLALLNNKNKALTTGGVDMNQTATTSLGTKAVTKFKTFNFERRTTTRYNMP